MNNIDNLYGFKKSIFDKQILNRLHATETLNGDICGRYRHLQPCSNIAACYHDCQ
jgi:hypothetical protein